MKIKSLTVRNFRNLKTQKIKFFDGLNVLVGKNAQGKTNTLEAIYLLTIGKSPKSRRDGEMICFNQKELEVNLVFCHKQVEKDLKILINHQNKQIFLNGQRLKKLSDVIGNFGSVYFSPEELDLIKKGPSNRRRFLDIINCQLSKDYLKTLQTFQHLLAQRNAVLKKQNIEKQIAVWDEQLSLFGTNLFFKRQKFLKEIEAIAKEIHKKLSNNTEELELCYTSELKEDNTLKDYKKNLEQNFEKDRILGYTSFGVQNDDFVIKINKKDAKKVASQGQQRTATLALKLAELEILKNEYGDYPVLLLDDVLSELDDERRQKLCDYIKDIQCILTCTDFDLNLSGTIFDVKDGMLNRKEENTNE